jgi:hypothetical protein
VRARWSQARVSKSKKSARLNNARTLTVRTTTVLDHHRVPKVIDHRLSITSSPICYISRIVSVGREIMSVSQPPFFSALREKKRFLKLIFPLLTLHLMQRAELGCYQNTDVT